MLVGTAAPWHSPFATASAGPQAGNLASVPCDGSGEPAPTVAVRTVELASAAPLASGSFIAGEGSTAPLDGAAQPAWRNPFSAEVRLTRLIIFCEDPACIPGGY